MAKVPQAAIDAGQEVAKHLDEIAKLFLPSTKLTFLARSTSVADHSRDLVMTTDDLGEVIKALQARMTPKAQTLKATITRHGEEKPN